MKNNTETKPISLILLMIVSLTFISSTRAQSTDIDNPTILTSNVVTGEGDGKAETFYYAFTAVPGDLKVTVDAKTDNYSVIMDTALTDEDGKDLLTMSTVANDTGKRDVADKHFVREQKVILRVRLPKDDHLKLLTYRIKLDGAVKIEMPPVPVEPAPVDAVTPVTDPATADQGMTPPVSESTPSQSPAATEEAKKTSTKNKIKEKIKKEVKKAVKNNVPD